MSNEYNLVNANVTCHVEECENEGMVITIAVDAGAPVVVCGACTNQITDVVMEEEGT